MVYSVFHVCQSHTKCKLLKYTFSQNIQYVHVHLTFTEYFMYMYVENRSPNRFYPGENSWVFFSLRTILDVLCVLHVCTCSSYNLKLRIPICMNLKCTNTCAFKSMHDLHCTCVYFLVHRIYIKSMYHKV